MKIKLQKADLYIGVNLDTMKVSELNQREISKKEFGFYLVGSIVVGAGVILLGVLIMLKLMGGAL